jgi:hypothetical protein
MTKCWPNASPHDSFSSDPHINSVTSKLRTATTERLLVKSVWPHVPPPKQFYRFQSDLTFKIYNVQCRIPLSKRPAWSRQQLPGLPGKMVQHILLKRWVTFNRLRGVISQRQKPSWHCKLFGEFNFVLYRFTIKKTLPGTQISFRNVTS